MITEVLSVKDKSDKKSHVLTANNITNLIHLFFKLSQSPGSFLFLF